MTKRVQPLPLLLLSSFLLLAIPFQSSYSLPRNHTSSHHHSPSPSESVHGERDLLFLSIQLHKQRAMEKVQQCKDYYEKVITRAYFEIEEPTNDEDRWAFIRDEKKALHFLNQYAPEKKTHYEDDLFHFMSLSIKCTEENYKAMDEFFEKHKDGLNCGDLFPEFEFQKALIYALKHYPWSKTTKAKAKNVLLQGLKFNADHALCSLELALSSSVLEYLAMHNLVDASLAQEIKSYHQDVNKYWDERVQKFHAAQKNKEQRLSESIGICEKGQKDFLQDYKQNQNFKIKLTQILEKISI